MDILSNSYHVIDVENEKIVFKNITGDMSDIIKRMIENIASNPSSKRYKPQSMRTVTASVITDILKLDLNSEEGKKQYYSYAEEISEKLLMEEIKVQRNMAHLNGVQKGCLIQALIKIGEDNYRYFIAKIEHANFVDGIELVLKEGFNPDENKIWKTCIFTCYDDEGDIDVSEAGVYVNNKANYWANEFLELVEMRSDEKNTKDAWKGIETELKNNMRKKYPNDYFVLRSAVISYFRRQRIIKYYEMINDIFNEYRPIDADTGMINVLKTRLLDLPDRKNFDSNFVSKPKEVKAKIKSVHKVNHDIDIIIKEGINNNITEYKDIIHSEQKPNGDRQLIIKITEDEAYKMFNLK